MVDIMADTGDVVEITNDGLDVDSDAEVLVYPDNMVILTPDEMLLKGLSLLGWTEESQCPN